MILGKPGCPVPPTEESRRCRSRRSFHDIQTTHKVFHPTTGQYLGYLVNRLAVVQVSQIDKDLTTVQIVRAYAAVSPGDPVMKFVLPTDEGAAVGQPSVGDVEGRVVEFQSNMGIMTMVAQMNVVYLDRGREDGIRPGDRMEVVRYRRKSSSTGCGRIENTVPGRPNCHGADHKIDLPHSQGRSL